MTDTHLPEIAGLTAVRRWTDREQWTTCHIGSLKTGTVFALPEERPIRPVVLTEEPGRIDAPDRISTHMNASSAGVLISEARYVDTGEPVDFKLGADTSVLTRCDLHYTHTAD